MKQIKKIHLLFVALASVAACADFAPDGVPFVVAEKEWPADGLGNHRAVVRVSETGGVARAVKSNACS